MELRKEEQFKRDLEKLFNKLTSSRRIHTCTMHVESGNGQFAWNMGYGGRSMYQVKGELIGHMGASGTYAYYYPETDLYFVGDVNQLANPALIFTVPLEIAKIANKYMGQYKGE